MPVSQWLRWAERRRARGAEVAKLYTRQAQAAEKMVLESGCMCDPIISLPNGPDGPRFNVPPMVTHALDCTHEKGTKR